MTALSADAPRSHRGKKELDVIPIATGEQIRIGSAVVFKTSTGRAKAASAATGQRTAGVAIGFIGPNGDGLGVTDGSEEVEVAYLDEREFAIATAIRTNAALGLDVNWADDNTVAGVAVGTAALRIAAGELVRFSTSDKSKGWVAVRRFRGVAIAI